MSLSIFESVLLLLASAVTVSVICKRLRLPTILGYLSLGIILGPDVLSWVTDSAEIRDLAEFGVVLLIFTIGLEFSFSKLANMKFIVFGFGGLQVLLSVAVTTFVGRLIGMTSSEAIVVGCVVAMSSTAIVLKQLRDQHELAQ